METPKMDKLAGIGNKVSQKVAVLAQEDVFLLPMTSLPQPLCFSPLYSRIIYLKLPLTFSQETLSWKT